MTWFLGIVRVDDVRSSLKSCWFLGFFFDVPHVALRSSTLMHDFCWVNPSMSSTPPNGSTKKKGRYHVTSNAILSFSRTFLFICYATHLPAFRCCCLPSSTMCVQYCCKHCGVPLTESKAILPCKHILDRRKDAVHTLVCPPNWRRIDTQNTRPGCRQMCDPCRSPRARWLRLKALEKQNAAAMVTDESKVPNHGHVLHASSNDQTEISITRPAAKTGQNEVQGYRHTAETGHGGKDASLSLAMDSVSRTNKQNKSHSSQDKRHIVKRPRLKLVTDAETYRQGEEHGHPLIDENYPSSRSSQASPATPTLGRKRPWDL